MSMKILIALLLILFPLICFSQGQKHYQWVCPDSTYKYVKIQIISKPKWLITHDSLYEIAAFRRQIEYENKLIKQYIR